MYLAIAVVRAISIVVDKSMVQSNIISLVGLLSRRAGRRGVVDNFQPGHHDWVAAACFGRHFAGKIAEGGETGLQGVYRIHQRVHSLVPT